LRWDTGWLTVPKTLSSCDQRRFGTAVIVSTLPFTGNTAQGVVLDGDPAERGQSGDGLGGAIFDFAGSVTLTNCTFATNTADDRGSLYVLGYDAFAGYTPGGGEGAAAAQSAAGRSPRTC
jgi:hypothetical protein